MKLKKICIVTGSTGLIGSETVKFFIKKKFKVVGIDNDLRKFFFGKAGSTFKVKKNLIGNHINLYEHHNVDIRNKKKLTKIFSKYKKEIKIIVHCAAQPSHDWAYKNPFMDFDVNTISTFNLLELTKKFSPTARFIFMSTNKVYGDNPNKFKLIEKKTRFELKKSHKFYKGINESLSIDSCVHSFFGASKLSADILVQEYGKNFGLKTVCFRGGCLTGPAHAGAELHGFLSYLVKTIMNQKTYNIYGYKGKQVRDNLHSSDLVNAFWEFYKKPLKGVVYNIGGSRKSNCSILEAINLIEEYSGIKSKLKYVKKNRTGDHIWWISDNNKFIKDFPNWKVKHDVKKVIKEMVSQHDA